MLFCVSVSHQLILLSINLLYQYSTIVYPLTCRRTAAFPVLESKIKASMNIYMEIYGQIIWYGGQLTNLTHYFPFKANNIAVIFKKTLYNAKLSSRTFIVLSFIFR